MAGAEMVGGGVDSNEGRAFVAFGFSCFVGTVWVRRGIEVSQLVSAQEVLEWSRVAHAGGTHTETDVLGQEARRSVDRHHGDVLTGWLIRVAGSTGDVVRIVEQAVYVEGDLGCVELSIAEEARPSWATT